MDQVFRFADADSSYRKVFYYLCSNHFSFGTVHTCGYNYIWVDKSILKSDHGKYYLEILDDSNLLKFFSEEKQFLNVE